jgi:2-dehydro-3-deoxy-D-arabinonate dehydratase
MEGCAVPIVRFRAPGSSQPAIGLLAGDHITPLGRGSEPASIRELLQLSASEVSAVLDGTGSGESMALDSVELLAPIDDQEVWAAGVTYRRSRDARMEESTQRDVYDLVYDADRPELFMKATPRRVAGPGQSITVRSDSTWDVPEPELVLVINTHGEIVGYTVGNDVSSRSIEGENPLYLPQAKIYDHSAALGPAIALVSEVGDPLALSIQLVIERDGAEAFRGETSTAEIHRSLDELVSYLFRGNSFPDGAFLMTGTGIVPPDEFTLSNGDVVHISIDGIGTLTNPVRTLDVNAS